MLYSERQALADTIRDKINKSEQLTKQELDYIVQVLQDPLQEFCLREGTFRLVEILNVDPNEAEPLEDEACQIIRDNIDYNDRLYDTFDDELRELLEKKGGEN